MGGCNTAVTSFVRKLYQMVNREHDNVVGFIADGTAFEVKDPRKLEQDILPKYFRHSRFQSLVRQLNFYSFKKISKERSVWIYKHALFRRDEPELLHALKRKTNQSGVVPNVVAVAEVEQSPKAQGYHHRGPRQRHHGSVGPSSASSSCGASRRHSIGPEQDIDGVPPRQKPHHQHHTRGQSYSGRRPGANPTPSSAHNAAGGAPACPGVAASGHRNDHHSHEGGCCGEPEASDCEGYCHLHHRCRSGGHHHNHHHDSGGHHDPSSDAGGCPSSAVWLQGGGAALSPPSGHWGQWGGKDRKERGWEGDGRRGRVVDKRPAHKAGGRSSGKPRSISGGGGGSSNKSEEEVEAMAMWGLSALCRVASVASSESSDGETTSGSSSWAGNSPVRRDYGMPWGEEDDEEGEEEEDDEEGEEEEDEGHEGWNRRKRVRRTWPAEEDGPRVPEVHVADPMRCSPAQAGGWIAMTRQDSGEE
ncbi:unnamed protein product, partial [Discosporangium mesarthrocarpum]